MKRVMTYRIVSSIEQAQTRLERLRTEVRTCARRIDRMFPELASDIYLATFEHVPPKFNDHFDTVVSLHGKGAILDAIVSDLSCNFKGIRNADAVIKKVQSLKSYADGKLDKAMGQMTSCCKKFQPEYYKITVSKILAFINSLVNNEILKCSNLDLMSLARSIRMKSNKDVTGSQFACYFRFQNLRDKSGFEYSEYYMVITCLVDKFGRFRMGLAFQPHIKMLGQFQSEFFHNHLDAIHMIKAFLKENNFL